MNGIPNRGLTSGSTVVTGAGKLFHQHSGLPTSTETCLTGAFDEWPIALYSLTGTSAGKAFDRITIGLWAISRSRASRRGNRNGLRTQRANSNNANRTGFRRYDSWNTNSFAYAASSMDGVEPDSANHARDLCAGATRLLLV